MNPWIGIDYTFVVCEKITFNHIKIHHILYVFIYNIKITHFLL